VLRPPHTPTRGRRAPAAPGRNQTRGEPKATKRFINDTIRNDFHRRFLERYIK
jgi:hypothetical protein